jgi:hypothetical protein
MKTYHSGGLAWPVYLLTAFVCLASSSITGAADKPKVKPAEDPQVKVGEAIYRNGLLPAGDALKSVREGGIVTEGAAAACINCHRRSGLGAREGRGAVPPVTGRYLFRPRTREGSDDTDVPYIEGMRGEREPYTDATLARAIREGLDSEGKPLNYLMPRFTLQDSEVTALIAYLKSMDPRRVPGVQDRIMHFATIITPDADPAKKSGMLAVMEQFFNDRNARQMGTAPTMRSSNKTAYSRSMNMVHRQWMLHVWELTGAESTWTEQLNQHLAKEPVFAVISGLAGKTWAPVHEFCEKQKLPCLFPNVEAPPATADQDFYSLYLNKGIWLEADLIARGIRESGVKKFIQLYREGDIGETAAATLVATLKNDGVTVTNKVIPRNASPESIAAAVKQSSDGLIMWLRAADIAALPDEAGNSAPVFLSGLMAGLEGAPLPARWRQRSKIAYGFDLPDKRRVRVDYALGWFRMRKIAVVAEQVQADTYLALGLVSETIKHMVDAFIPDYLVERTQDLLEHRAVTGYYPRLSMAPGQRFASKGGYLVHLADTGPRRVIADGEWTIP